MNKILASGISELQAYLKISEGKTIIEEESSDVDTSDDDLEVNNAAVLSNFKAALTSNSKRDSTLQKSLEKNKVKSKNIFGREPVYICATFTDWVPVELKSRFEIKAEQEHKDDLEKWLDSQKGPDGVARSEVLEEN